jgi:hypothetical protein
MPEQVEEESPTTQAANRSAARGARMDASMSAAFFSV